MKIWRNKHFLTSLGFALLLLFFSLVVNYYAGLYANEKASNPVTDIVLDNIPVFDVDGIFIYGPFIFWLVMILANLKRPQILPFGLKSVALFVLIRSAFITLTHIGPFPDQLAINYESNFVQSFTFGADLFFSAHTGLPFLMTLIFWDRPQLRFFALASSIFFGAIVLMAHLHYSIDVLSAFFITYTIYHLALLFFKKDYEMFKNGLPESSLV